MGDAGEGRMGDNVTPSWTVILATHVLLTAVASLCLQLDIHVQTQGGGPSVLSMGFVFLAIAN